MRHGQSTWNYERRIQGQLDPPLSDEGRRQAVRLGQRLAGRTFAGLYTSDLKRAAETAQLVGQAVGLEAMPMAELREIFLGQWEGLRTEELAARFPEAWASWTDEPDWDLVPGGEGSAAFEARVSVALDRLFQRHPHGDMLAVTHGGVIQIALHHVVGRPGRGIFPFRIQNASVSVLERRNGRVVVSGVNDIGHLEVASEAAPEIV
ncbi:MAG TPA: histidine phosphatase family protein [Candidatus Dormibacteraeota bacterium]|nr:histidine phosphatase family protein [Candidatus Dormibacteraeota bacterium]